MGDRRPNGRRVMDWLSDLGYAVLHATARAAGVMFAAGVTLIVLALATLIWMLIGRRGGVTLGPDPKPRRVLSDATTVIFPASLAAPNYHRSELVDWYPLAPLSGEVLPQDPAVTRQLDAVRRYFDRAQITTTTEVLHTRELVIAIPEPPKDSARPQEYVGRRRIDEGLTLNLADVVRRAKEMKP